MQPITRVLSVALLFLGTAAATAGELSDWRKAQIGLLDTNYRVTVKNPDPIVFGRTKYTYLVYGETCLVQLGGEVKPLARVEHEDDNSLGEFLAVEYTLPPHPTFEPGKTGGDDRFFCPSGTIFFTGEVAFDGWVRVYEGREKTRELLYGPLGKPSS